MKSYYFVAIVAPPDLNAKAQEMKEELFRRFGTKAAMKAPVHITLFSPFNFDPAEEQLLVDALHEAATGYSSFPVSLRNFAAFSPRVIYIDVLPSDELKKIHSSVVDRFLRVPGLRKANDERNFHPHMTIGNRDWNEGAFEEAWKDFSKRKFEADFKAAGITLLRLFEDGWKSVAEARLDGEKK